MKKRASKGRHRQKRNAIIVPPSPYSFEETVARVLKAKPPEKPAKKAPQKRQSK